MKVLVIGGTGMLGETVNWLVREGHQLWLLNRGPLREPFLRQPSIQHLPCDYQKDGDFEESLQIAPTFELVLAWFHGDSAAHLSELFTHQTTQPEWTLVHVLGSAASRDTITANIKSPANCTRHHVQLGFKLEGNQSRWLTHEEISEGAIRAIRKRENVLVGQLDPWELRP